MNSWPYQGSPSIWQRVIVKKNAKLSKLKLSTTISEELCWNILESFEHPIALSRTIEPACCSFLQSFAIPLCNMIEFRSDLLSKSRNTQNFIDFVEVGACHWWLTWCTTSCYVICQPLKTFSRSHFLSH